MDNVTAQILQQFSDKSFGLKPKFIVDVDHPLPAGMVVNVLYCETNVAGFSCVDHKLLTGSGAHPATLLAGTELPSVFTDVVVTEGSIYCMVN